MQRSILILILALSVVLLLTVVIFENPPVVDEQAARAFDGPASAEPRATEDGEEATYDRYAILGQEYWRRGDLDKAEEMFRMALLHDRKNPEILQVLGQIVFVQGRYDEARVYFEQCRELAPKDVESYTNLAISLLCLNRLDESSRVAEEGLEKTGESSPGPFHLILACNAQRRGETERAAGHLVRAHEYLGRDLRRFTQARWAAPLRQSQAYESLHLDAEPPTSRQETPATD